MLLVSAFEILCDSTSKVIDTQSSSRGQHSASSCLEMKGYFRYKTVFETNLFVYQFVIQSPESITCAVIEFIINTSTM